MLQRFVEAVELWAIDVFKERDLDNRKPFSMDPECLIENQFTVELPEVLPPAGVSSLGGATRDMGCIESRPHQLQAAES